MKTVVLEENSVDYKLMMMMIRRNVFIIVLCVGRPSANICGPHHHQSVSLFQVRRFFNKEGNK
jgi:hypothetical protein